MKLLKILVLFISFKYMSCAFSIFNGTPLSPQETQYVYKIKLEQSDKAFSPCSATIISNKSILTSAHCVDFLDMQKAIYLNIQDYKLKVENFWVPRPYYKYIKKFHNYVKSKDWSMQTYFHKVTAIYDLAIINFKDELPTEFNQVTLSFNQIMPGKWVTAIGMGYTDYDFITKLFHTETSIPYYRNIILEEKRVRSRSFLRNTIYYLRSLNKNDFITTPGDSGGPLLLKDSNIQIGVLRGILYDKDDKNGSIYTPLFWHEDFILKYAKNL